MAMDRQLLANLASSSHPTLHLYEWARPTATYGHFIQPDDHLRVEEAKSLGLDLVKRPTGGGILLHTSDLAFSILLPSSHPALSDNTLANYRWVNTHVIEAVRRFTHNRVCASLLPIDPEAKEGAERNFCMAKPTIYDIVVDNLKVGGAAQRRTRHGLLHQGTLSLGRVPSSILERLLRPESQVMEAMARTTYALLGSRWTTEELEQARIGLRDALTEVFANSRDETC